jgi:hypothetical protein
LGNAEALPAGASVAGFMLISMDHEVATVAEMPCPLLYDD